MRATRAIKETAIFPYNIMNHAIYVQKKQFIVPVLLTRYVGVNALIKSRVSDISQITMRPYFVNTNRTPDYTVTLKSAVVHLGSTMESGHYVTYIFENDGSVLLMDDLHGIQYKRFLDEKEWELIEKNAYVLMYTTDLHL